MIDRPDVLRLFASQFGVADVTQLCELGIPRRTINWSCNHGTLVKVLPGVVRLLSTPHTFEARAMAVQLHTSPAGFLSGWTAGRLYGLRSMPAKPIQVTVPCRGRSHLPAWVSRFGSSWIAGDDVVSRNGFQLERPVRMLLMLADQFNQFRFEKAAEDLWHLGLITPEEAADYLQAVRRQGRHGITVMDTWLRKTGARARPSQSNFEMDLAAAIRGVGLPEPQHQYPLLLATGETIHLDLAWPDVMLGVEPGHSWWHGGDRKASADAARDRACSELGWQILRYDESAQTDLAAAAREVRRVHATRLRMLGHT